MYRPRAPRHLAWPAALAALLALSPELGGAGVVSPGAHAQLRQERVAGLRDVQGVQQEPEGGRVARFAVRLEQLEEQLRQLTGRVEQLEFERRQLLDLVQSLEARLAASEGGTAPATSPAPLAEAPAGSVTRPAVAATAPEPQPQVATTPESAPASDEGTLGTIPQSALLTLPEPRPEAVTEPPRGDVPPQEQYDAAMDLLRAGDYAAAERGLELFLDLFPEHPLAPNAAYWLAETHYVRKNFAAAAASFARNYRTYGKDTPKAADNLLKLGMSLEGLGERDKACLSYDELAKEFPGAPAHIQQALARERTRAECV